MINNNFTSMLESYNKLFSCGILRGKLISRKYHQLKTFFFLVFLSTQHNEIKLPKEREWSLCINTISIGLISYELHFIKEL